MKSFLIISITIIVTLSAAFFSYRAYKKKYSKPDKGPAVQLENPRQGNLAEIVSAPGQIEPKSKVEISAKISARLIELPYEEGDRVTKERPDQSASVLVKLDDKDLQSYLKSAKAASAAQAAQIEVQKATIEGQKAALESFAASLKLAQQNYKRKKELLGSQDISQSTFDASQCKLDELKANYESSKYKLQSAKLNLIVLHHNLEASKAKIAQAQEAVNNTIITSPMDGVITQINAEVGEVVMTGTMNNPGTVIMEVADLSRMLVVAQVDEIDVGKLRVGQKAKVFVQAFDKQMFSGVVDTIALNHRMSVAGTKYFRTEILLDTNDVQLYSGLTAHVEIETYVHEDILKIPSQAILGRPVDGLPPEIRSGPNVNRNKTFATVVYRFVNGKSVVTPVKVGSGDITHTIVESGLNENDRVIIGPYKILESIQHDQNISDEIEAEKDPNSIPDANSKKANGQ